MDKRIRSPLNISLRDKCVSSMQDKALESEKMQKNPSDVVTKDPF